VRSRPVDAEAVVGQAQGQAPMAEKDHADLQICEPAIHEFCQINLMIDD
jgi:hypothetical protein